MGREGAIAPFRPCTEPIYWVRMSRSTAMWTQVDVRRFSPYTEAEIVRFDGG